jgi:hypothetical protein
MARPIALVSGEGEPSAQRVDAGHLRLPSGDC